MTCYQDLRTIRHLTLAFAVVLSGPATMRMLGQASTPTKPNTLRIEQQEFREKGLTYSIDLLYPEIEGETQFNKAVHSIIDPLKKMGAGMPKTREPEPFYDGYVTGTYETARLENGIISILFKFSNYYPGAAHPWGTMASANYDTNTHRIISLSDLFRTGSPYLSKLSEISIRKLESSEYADSFTIRKGAGPHMRNFSVFTLTNATLVLHFQQYQVAAGAAGDLEVSIPFEELTPLLRQKFLKE
jgi:hypothetical protein